MNKVNVGIVPPSVMGSTIDRYDEIVKAALENKGQWVSTTVGQTKVNTNHYSLIYRQIAKELGVSVKHLGDTLYVLIPK